MKTFNLIITEIDAPRYSGEALSVTVPAENGEMTILANHEALIARLKTGTITVKDTEGSHTFDIESGVLEIAHNAVTILL